MKPVAIIPARGGSKRLPRKNILPLAGAPLLAHVVIKAIESKIFEKVIVSTEDKEIANIARNYGASVFSRKDILAQDSSTVVEVCLDVLKHYQVNDFCCLYATSALLSSQTIKDSYKKFISEGADVLMGVSSYNYSPMQALKVDINNNATLLMEGFEGLQSQIYPKIKVSNGTLYWARKRSFENEKTFYSKGLKVFDIPECEVCDIDTKEDYLRLQKIYEENSI